ncbi:MAG TPA: hypothetical protein VEO91_06655 [Candidatus Limnocylindria bacterium]|nr:hypothetical protein [Candidatus Limnocylindria bacterium]
MKALRIILPLVIAFAMAAVAPAVALGSTACHSVDATGVGQDLGEGRTVAQISDGGLLQGTTAASFQITGLSGTVASFAGTITFTTNRGTLTATVAGTLDLATGAFSATSSSLSGTGKLAGASGSLVFNGVENLATGTFTEVITGSICVDLAP